MKIFLLNFLMFCFTSDGLAQKADTNNIWEIINTFFVTIGKATDDDHVYPYKDSNYLVLPCYIIAPDGDIIKDLKYNIPINDKLHIYEFGDWAPHEPAYYLLVKDGTTYIINTRTGFRESIVQCIESFDRLNLEYDEMKQIIRSVVQEYDETNTLTKIKTN